MRTRRLLTLHLGAQCFVDTVGIAADYQKKLEEIFPDITFVVTSKADSIYPIVSAASIAAKVTRDRVLEAWTFVEGEGSYGEKEDAREFGSGYPGGASRSMYATGGGRLMLPRYRPQDDRMAREQRRLGIWLPYRSEVQLADGQDDPGQEGCEGQVVRPLSRPRSRPFLPIGPPLTCTPQERRAGHYSEVLFGGTGGPVQGATLEGLCVGKRWGVLSVCFE